MKEKLKRCLLPLNWNTLQRRNLVLEKMKEYSYITDEQYQTAIRNRGKDAARRTPADHRVRGLPPSRLGQGARD